MQTDRFCCHSSRHKNELVHTFRQKSSFSSLWAVTKGKYPAFTVNTTHLKGGEEQPAAKTNWSSQARIFCRYLGPNSGLWSLLACHLLLKICQHPFQPKKPNDLSTKTWLLTPLPSSLENNPIRETILQVWQWMLTCFFLVSCPLTLISSGNFYLLPGFGYFLPWQ